MTPLAQHRHHPRDAFRGRTIKGPAGIVKFIPSHEPVDIEDDEPTNWGDWQTPETIANAITEHHWTDDELRHAHAAHVAGRREPWTIAGHREWDRRYRAAKRAKQRMSAEDMAWCERQVNAWFWQEFERANRRDGATESAMHKARILARTLSTGHLPKQSTPPVENGISPKANRVFDEAPQPAGRTA